jgi:hypothetical protein
MRPIDKGTAPTSYTRYQDAGPDLQARIGDYCCYCERHIETNLAVEHVQPKDLVPVLATNWSNFLLSDYFWPDIDNTLKAFDYIQGGVVVPKPALAPALLQKAYATIRLTGLDCYPGNPGREPTSADKRWLTRLKAWQLAERYRSVLLQEDTATIRELIVDLALSCGEFSIWWTVFSGDIDMRRRLREAFVGTHSASFDANEDPLPRIGGQL